MYEFDRGLSYISSLQLIQWNNHMPFYLGSVHSPFYLVHLVFFYNKNCSKSVLKSRLALNLYIAAMLQSIWKIGFPMFSFILSEI